MNITLIRPPAYSTGFMGVQRVPYLGIAYVAAATRQAGHTVDIVDMCGEDIDHTEIVHGKYIAYGMPFSALKERIKPSEVIGFSCSFSQDWVFHRELIQYVHRLFPKSIVVAGGEHISALPEYCLADCQELDICVVGEGEEVFPRLLEVLEKDGSLQELPSIISRVFYTAKPTRIGDIDKIPLPAWDLTPMENYLSRGLNYHARRGRTIPMLGSRGCPFSCTFCSNSNMWSAPWIARKPALIVDEMLKHFIYYGADNFVFSDLTAVVDTKAIRELCHEILKHHLNITWQLPTLRTEKLDRDILRLMYQAGCRELDFAIESGSRRVLESVNKKSDPEKMVALIKDALKEKIRLSVNIILGLPRERLRDFLETYWLVIRLAVMGIHDINVFPFVPYPGSKLFTELYNRGEIKLFDEFFKSLFGYADLGKAVSWSPHFGPKTLRFMRLFLLVSFYTLMFATHPFRLINIARGKPTKLGNVLGRIFNSLRIYEFKE